MSKRKHSPKTNTSPVARVVEPNAAGIDIGATEIFVAVPADRDAQPVRCFATFTCELEQIANWLKKCGVESVVMECSRERAQEGRVWVYTQLGIRESKIGIPEQRKVSDAGISDSGRTQYGSVC